MPHTLPSFFQSRLAKLVLLTSIATILVVTVSASTVPSRFLTTTCATLTPARTSVVSGSQGAILFKCGTNAALVVNKAGSATPSFILPGGFTMLTIVIHVSGATSCTPGRVLVPDQESGFSKPGIFDYCVTYANPPFSGLSSFTLTWSKQ